LLRCLGVESRPQDRAGTDARACGALKRAHRVSRSKDMVGRITTLLVRPGDRSGFIVTELDVLTGDLLLVVPASVVVTDDGGVGRRALRPVDPAIPELQLLGGMIAGRQTRDEWRHVPGAQVDPHDARAVVASGRPQALVRVG